MRAVLLFALAGCGSELDDDGLTPAELAPDTGADAATRPAPVAVDPPACGAATARDSVIPGPQDDGYDAALAEKARRFDRVFHAVVAWPMGLNTEVQIADDHPGRAVIASWLEEDDGWDLEAWSGQSVTALVDGWTKAGGAYGGVGLAADAYRYGALRDEGADCDEVDVARTQLLRGLDGLHRAVAITGTPGVIARAIARTDLGGLGPLVEVVPLFDDAGNPLPEEKNNGTWRADNSGGLYEDTVWEDSCSRDYLIGWAIGFGAAWEVIAADETIDAEVKERLADDARALGHALTVVGESGRDLEIPDADGRVTYHGYLHEEAIDRVYLGGSENGQNALMALGIMGTYAAVSRDPVLQSYVDRQLVEARDLADIAERTAWIIDFGAGSNYSGYNMGFAGGWLAQRMICDAGAQDDLRAAIDTTLYDRPGEDRQPIESSQALYHLVAAKARMGGSAFGAGDSPLEQDLLDRTLVVLDEFPDPPFFTEERENCDAAEIESGVCVADDGTELTLLGYVGWNDKLVAEEPVPMRLRPHSNYYWRSNPYEVNGGSSGSLFAGVDFRFVYWAGRYLQR